MGHHKINIKMTKKKKKKTEQEWSKKTYKLEENIKNWREKIGTEIEIYGDLDLESILFLCSVFIYYAIVYEMKLVLIWFIMQLIRKRERIRGIT